MRVEANEWVEEQGGDRGNGWLLNHPLMKCFRYQTERANNGKNGELLYADEVVDDS